MPRTLWCVLATANLIAHIVESCSPCINGDQDSFLLPKGATHVLSLSTGENGDFPLQMATKKPLYMSTEADKSKGKDGS
jgi:hypothetical protein